MPDRETSNSIDNSIVHNAWLAETIHLHAPPPLLEPPAQVDRWVDLALRSTIWHHIAADRDPEPFRQGVALAVAALAAVRDDAERLLSEDPWQDPKIADRFLDRVEWLLGEQATDLDLYPAEAALLVLFPFLYRVHDLRLAAEHSTLVPSSLTFVAEDDGARASFESFVAEHGALAERARLRPECEATVGWWLFHRWLSRQEQSPERLLGLLDLIAGSGLGETVAARRIGALLHGVRRGPDVCNPEFLDQLPADDHVRAPGRQRIRDRRLCLITALAHGCSIGITGLPVVVAEHLGIPHAVDPAQLRHTLEHATWGRSHDLPVLRAECHHEAVIEALREYTARADELLHAVRRAVWERITQPMPKLPTRFSSAEVTPAEDAFTGWARFRLDEHRVRDLLMGVQLYKDPDLAVRELYQNALDACRYRRARTEYLDRTEHATHAYEGLISFEQDVDDQGRPYLECHDNGIGMGDAELRGVFSRAGDRFAEQVDFKLERETWNRLDPPVELHPNSRFGIGVLSYFMLADEIRVTTCRFGHDGVPGPVFEVSIHGAGHLFRITKIADRGDESGTRVRLYLRDTSRVDWSSVNVLRRLLGIAEFETVARRQQDEVRWTPGELRLRDASVYDDRPGLVVSGDTASWDGAPRGARVIWCEGGGALLVDGLVVRPSVHRGAFSSTGAGLTGVVVDLSGPLAPKNLSIDRSEVLDDLSERVGGLLRAATATLVLEPRKFLTYEWICKIANGNPFVADIVTAALLDADCEVVLRGQRLRVRDVGCFPVDLRILGLGDRRVRRRSPSESTAGAALGNLPDEVLLWRLLAHRPTRLLTSLISQCPELGEVGAVVPALPSDMVLHCGTVRTDIFYWFEGAEARLNAGGSAATILSLLGWSPADRVQRSVELRIPVYPLKVLAAEPLAEAKAFAGWLAEPTSGLSFGEPVSVNDLLVASRHLSIDVDAFGELLQGGRADVADVVLAVAQATASGTIPPLNFTINGEDLPLDGFDDVPPGYVALASEVLEVPVSEVCARLARCGLDVDRTGLPEYPDDSMVQLLSQDLDWEWPWLSRSEPLAPDYVMRASFELEIEPEEVVERLAALGFQGPSGFPFDHPGLSQVEMGPLRGGEEGDELLRPPGPVSYRHIFDSAAAHGLSVGEVVSTLRLFGFEISLRIPSKLDAVDEAILGENSPLSWSEVMAGDPMPLAHVILAAHEMRMGLVELMERLASYGIPTSAQELPGGMTESSAIELLGGTDDLDDPYLVKGNPPSLLRLVDISSDMDMPLPEVVSALQALGLDVPDLATTIRAALAKVPFAGPPPQPH